MKKREIVELIKLSKAQCDDDTFVFLLHCHREKNDKKERKAGNILPVFADEWINVKQR
jgi:hypothetical protein